MKLIGLATPKKELRSRVKGQIQETAGIVDFGKLLGASGHLACQACNHPWFEVYVDGCNTTFTCKHCNFTAKGLMPNQFDQQGVIRCPDCIKKQHDARWMAIIFSNDIVCMGCQRCAWELRSSLILELGKIIA